MTLEADKLLDVLATALPGSTVRELVSDATADDRPRARLVETTTVSYAYLDRHERPLVLRLYPGDTLGQARALYGDAARVDAVLALRASGWSIRPNFHFGSFRRGYVWTTSRLDADEYAAYWIDRIGQTRAAPRDEWDSWLEELADAGILDARSRSEFDEIFVRSGRASAAPRPGMDLFVTLPARPATAIVDAVRTRAAQALEALGEPLTSVRSAG